MTKKLSESSLLLTQEELQKQILGMTLFNDLLARAVLEDKEACEHILRILTGIKTLVIKKNKTQYVISKLSSHNIIMDVLAEDANNKLYEIEIQKADGGIAHEKRMLYYASTIINEYFFKGDQTYASVPELHIFYISQTDIWKLGKTCYPILKFLGDTTTPYNDGLHMCYINAEVNDSSDIAQLMQYFSTAAADDFSQGKLSQCINNLKTTKEGLTTMDNFSKQIYEAGINDGRAEGLAEGKAEGKAESIKNLMSTLNVSIDQAMDILKTPPEERQYFKDLLAKELQAPPVPKLDLSQNDNTHFLMPENAPVGCRLYFKQ